MQTSRLYFDDSYLRVFDARVIARSDANDRPAVALEQTAFHPNGGGQPSDTGTLDGISVTEVSESDRLVWHFLSAPLPSDEVRGSIDWNRRWDHMQNHSGQHILSQAFVLITEAETVGWHLSPNSLTIDLNRSDLNEEDLARAEDLANRVVQENRLISARQVSQAEAADLGLRKQPEVDGPLRIVEIADFDRVACSGTHVHGTAEVGLIKVLRAERRGPETRIHFVCGGRALADYARKHQMVRVLATRFTRGEDELLEAVEKLQQEAQANYRALRAAQDAWVEAESQQLWTAVKAEAPPRVVSGLYLDWEPDQVKRLALALRCRPGCFIALAGGDPPTLYFARSDDLDVSAGRILQQALAVSGGKGGGRAEYAQGRVHGQEAAHQAVDLAAALVSAP